MSKTNVIIFIITQNPHFGEDIQAMTTKVMVTLLALFAEIERGFIFSQDKGSAGGQESTRGYSWKAQRYNLDQYV
jgi:hypothetical protein